FNAVFNFSIKPLRMFSIFGLGVIGVTGVLAVVYLVLSLLTNPPRGIPTVVMLLLMNLGVTSLGIGILGEYIAKIYSESKRRPLWLVDYTLNMDGPAMPGIVGGLVGDRDQFSASMGQPRHPSSPPSAAA